MKLSTLAIYLTVIASCGGLLVWITGEIEAMFVGGMVGCFLALLYFAIRGNVKSNNIK